LQQSSSADHFYNSVGAIERYISKKPAFVFIPIHDEYTRKKQFFHISIGYLSIYLGANGLIWQNGALRGRKQIFFFKTIFD